MKTKINFTYVGFEQPQKELSFNIILDLPFTPFYGLNLLFESKRPKLYEKDFILKLNPSENKICDLTYSIDEDVFYINIIETVNWVNHQNNNQKQSEIDYFEIYGWELIKNNPELL